ncbi:MAG: U32 family peptidase [Firmicutes bacterium]|nr:U32 family peptidase [Bacillota bacterium]
MLSKSKNKNFIPELLAPAGTKEAFIAAVEAGADAVYCGGEIFNARMNAGNFSLEELREAVDFAHKRGVQVHVTLNTLLKDEELYQALEYGEQLWEMGVDALIVQDIGVAGLIKKYIPDMNLHMSTQGTVYDLDGVKAAAEMGFSRVVLARELTLEEIRRIIEGIKEEEIKPAEGDRLMEIEIFSHGALCYCYSGQCQMSRAIGGRSANRGACAQPCRMKYQSFGGGEGADKLMELKKPYPLSPADMDLIDFLPEISEAGVASIKIEGRMKSPEYVGTVTGIHRKYLDKIAVKERNYFVEPLDRLNLTQIFNRGFTFGNFYDGQDPKLMSGETPKNKGVLIGTVKSIIPVGKNKNGNRFLLDIEPSKKEEEIIQGDLIEVRDGNGLSDSVSAMVTYSEKVNGLFRVGDIKEKVFPGDRVYRLSSTTQMKEASGFYKGKDWREGKFSRKRVIDLNVVSDKEGIIKIYSSLGKAVVEAGPFEKSKSGEGCQGRLESALRKTGGTIFEVGDIKYRGDMDFVIPVFQINKMRRDLLLLVEESLITRREGIQIPSEDKVINLPTEDKGEPSTLEFYFYSLVDFKRFIADASVTFSADYRFILPAADMILEGFFGREEYEEYRGRILPYISNVDKGKEHGIVLKNFDVLQDYCLKNDVPIYVGNLSQLEALKGLIKDGIKLIGDYGINAYNNQAILTAASLGLANSIPSLETDKAHFGAYPLMTIEYDTDVKELVDRKGIRYTMIKPNYSDQQRLVRRIDSLDAKSIASEVKEALGERGWARYYVMY